MEAKRIKEVADLSLRLLSQVEDERYPVVRTEIMQGIIKEVYWEGYLDGQEEAGEVGENS